MQLRLPIAKTCFRVHAVDYTTGSNARMTVLGLRSKIGAAAALRWQ